MPFFQNILFFLFFVRKNKVIHAFYVNYGICNMHDYDSSSIDVCGSEDMWPEPELFPWTVRNI